MSTLDRSPIWDTPCSIIGIFFSLYYIGDLSDAACQTKKIFNPKKK